MTTLPTLPGGVRITPEFQTELHTLYRTLHGKPELSMQEHQTAAFITSRMKRLGYEAFVIGGTGVVAIMLNGDGSVVG